MDFLSNELGSDTSAEFQVSQFQENSIEESIIYMYQPQPTEFVSAGDKGVQENLYDALDDRNEDISFSRFQSNLNAYLLEK